jgi:hypothetical protein
VRILLVTYSYAPRQDPRAYRWSGIAEQWASIGNEVDVICAAVPNVPRSEVRPGLEVLRVGNSVLARARALVTRNQPAPVSGEADRAGFGSSKARRALRWAHDATWKRLYWPDSTCMWYWAGRRAVLKLLAERSYDAMISVSLPFVGHLVGLAGKREHPDLPWIVDIGDPFALMDATPVNNAALYGRLNRRAEGKVLELADRVAVTNESARRLYEDAFPFTAGKICVIPPMSGLSGPVPSRQGAREGAVLAYFGTLFPSIREPTAILELLRATVRIDPSVRQWLMVRFYGDASRCTDVFNSYSDISDLIQLRPYVSRLELPRAMGDADVLLNIGNTTSFQLPSKASDYLSSGMPILHLPGTDDDAFTALLRDHPLSRTFRITGAASDSDARVFRDFVTSCKGRRLDPSKIAAKSAVFAPSEIARRYSSLLREEERCAAS